VGGVCVEHEQLVVGLDERVEVTKRPDWLRVRERRGPGAVGLADRLERGVEVGGDVGPPPRSAPVSASATTDSTASTTASVSRSPTSRFAG
jgi:hypothetical protein